MSLCVHITVCLCVCVCVRERERDALPARFNLYLPVMITIDIIYKGFQGKFILLVLYKNSNKNDNKPTHRPALVHAQKCICRGAGWGLREAGWKHK